MCQNSIIIFQILSKLKNSMEIWAENISCDFSSVFKPVIRVFDVGSTDI
jgi:hypothetical protein